MSRRCMLEMLLFVGTAALCRFQLRERAAQTRRRIMTLRAVEDAKEDAEMMDFMRGKMKEAAAPPSMPNPFDALKRFGQGLDDFIDDAMMRKLGNGEKFYGKRKSDFYGKDDPGKRSAPDAVGEDYSGPVGGGYFRRDKEGRPVTRKGTPIGWEEK
mmetsp:Transcript_12183/g.36187  ORF Transcript_12183/g.36187 Transcript_12183/m.36187 type:complete len:156 (-) Transcript_12183:27-494(-)